MNLTVDISDAKVSSDPGAILATYSLGSCVGVTVYDPLARVGGLLHIQLPSSDLDPARAASRPNMFADTGLPLLVRDAESLGARRTRMKVKIAGAAQILDDKGVFNIGRRNYAAVRKALWQLGLLIAAEDVGGDCPRTLYLHVADGTVILKSRSTQRPL